MIKVLSWSEARPVVTIRRMTGDSLIVHVDLPGTPYDIRIEAGLIDRCGEAGAASIDTRIIVGGGSGLEEREKNTAATSPPCSSTEAMIPPVNRGAAAADT